MAETSSVRTRISEWWSSFPLFSRFLLFSCCGVYLVIRLFGTNFSQWCLRPIYVSMEFVQIYRVLTSPFFHAGILHLAFNMLTLSSLGPSLERSEGTLRMFFMVTLFVLLSGSLNVVLSMAASSFLNFHQFLLDCGVGFSGILFGLIVVDNHVSSVEQRSVMGLFSVPSRIYPIILLIFFSLFLPNVSFMGHLCGMIAGYLFVFGILSPLVPSASIFAKLESSSCWRSVMTLPGYCAASPLSITDLNASQTSLFSSASSRPSASASNHDLRAVPGGRYLHDNSSPHATNSRSSSNDSTPLLDMRSSVNANSSRLEMYDEENLGFVEHDQDSSDAVDPESSTS